MNWLNKNWRQNWRERVKQLHPDVNGGDTSKVKEFTNLMDERAKRKRICNCGCGRVRPPGRALFATYLCLLRYRSSRLVPCVAILVFCLGVSPYTYRRSVKLAWEQYPSSDITNDLVIMLHHSLDATNWEIWAAFSPIYTNASVTVDAREHWFTLSATNYRGVSFSNIVKLPADKKVRAPRDNS